MKHFIQLNLLAIVLASCTETAVVEKSPNILLLVADDLGYADLGVYGGDIETPNLDALAGEGILFSRFHASPLCAPTRAMLLSGNDNHIAGMGIQGVQREEWGYEGRISDRVALIPEILKQAGYNTYMAGKWHIGSTEDTNPVARGFDRSFVNIGSSGNHYNEIGLFAGLPISKYTEDGEAVEWPKGAYSTDLFTDKLIEYIKTDKESGKPFFAFAAYTSPHWPLQVDEKYWKKYEGRYDEGYEALKRQRLKSLQQAGMIDDLTLPPDHQRVTPWDSLSEDEKKMEARKMELYSGMVDNLDENIGRLFDYLKEIGEYENTVILFMSDNGAAAEDFYYHNRYGEFLKETYTDEYESMGNAESFISYGPQWAEAGSSPFRYFKQELTEGGLIAPMIVAGKGISQMKEINHELVTLQDIAPTFYEIGNTSYPDSLNGKPVYPMRGKSFYKLLSGESTTFRTENDIFAMEHSSKTMLRKGDWKLLNNERPFDYANFQLFNLADDIGEFNDLRESNPDKYQELLADWEEFIKETRTILPSPVSFD